MSKIFKVTGCTFVGALAVTSELTRSKRSATGSCMVDGGSDLMEGAAS